MFSVAEFTDAIASATDQLRLVQQELGAITCPAIATLTINLQHLTLESIGELLDDVPSGYRKTDKETDYVYVIRLPADKRHIVNSLWEQLEDARKLANDYCRINRENANTDTLYVGRSKKLKSRLTQHLGTEQHGVFSMHLQRWATGNDAEVSISYMKFERKEDLLVQAIEDGLWVSLRPAFGRKGER